MKSFTSVTNDHLHTLTLQASKHEKSATLDLLEHLAEIDRRRLYAEKGFPSLWIYVNEFLAYSESQTTERVSAMRLMVKIPEVKKELAEGKISLTTASKLATHVRREKVGQTETLNLLSSISGKTSRQVDQFLAQNSVVEYKMDKLKAVTAQTTRLIIDVDQDFLILLNRVRELKGHQGSSTQELLQTAMQSLVQKNSPKKINSQKINVSSANFDEPLRAREVKNNLNHSDFTQSNSVSNTNSTNSRYIPFHVRNEIRLRSGDQCEYVDSKSQQRCPCKTRLEFDHIIPFSMGGMSTIENLRHYCPAHNKLSAIKLFGSKHMNQFLKN